MSHIPKEYLGLTQVELEAMETIHSGQYGNLKIDDGEHRVWHSRMTRADGARFNYACEIEELKNGCWITVLEYQPD